jgi:hypothetical protein
MAAGAEGFVLQRVGCGAAVLVHGLPAAWTLHALSPQCLSTRALWKCTDSRPLSCSCSHLDSGCVGDDSSGRLQQQQLLCQLVASKCKHDYMAIITYCGQARVSAGMWVMTCSCVVMLLCLCCCRLTVCLPLPPVWRASWEPRH